jgi:hypothetical protein
MDEIRVNPLSFVQGIVEIFSVAHQVLIEARRI